MKSLKWLPELGLTCTIIKMLSIYAAFDISKLSADLKYTATGDLSTPHMLRPSALAGSISKHSCLLVPGCRQLAQAASRGFSAQHGHNCWPRTVPMQMAWLAAVPSFVYVNLSCWLPGAVWNLLRLYFWPILFTPAPHYVGAILNCSVGLAPARSFCQGAKME